MRIQADQRGIKELRKKIRLSRQIENQSKEMEERLKRAKAQELEESPGNNEGRQNGIGKEVNAYELRR